MSGSRIVLSISANCSSAKCLSKCVASTAESSSFSCSSLLLGSSLSYRHSYRSQQQFILILQSTLHNLSLLAPSTTLLVRSHREGCFAGRAILDRFSFIGHIIQIMNQQFLTNFSVVVLKSLQADGSLCLGSQSFIRSEIAMYENKMESLFENFLFCVEIEAGASQFRTPIEFQQPILLRHKISNKYLSYSSEFENEQNDTTVKLQLSDTRTFFRVLPCFQYQTKISNKVKFNQDVYLATELNSTKLGFLTLRPADLPQQMRTLIGLNYRSKILLHSYYQREKEEPGYIYGQAIWLSHIESGTFLTTLRPDAKEEIAFEELLPEEPLQSINGLWLIESIKAETGGHLYFGDSFRLKNLCTGRYLAFSRNYKLVDNQRVYSLLLEERPSEHSRFSFHSLKGEESRVLKGSYLIFHHQESGEYIGARRADRGETAACLPVRNFTEFEDEDLFEMIELDDEAEEAIRFIFSIRKEFKDIHREFTLRKPLGKVKAKEYRMLYLNIRQQLVKLAKLSELFLEVQEELGFCIPELCEHIRQLRARSAAEEELEQLLKLIYEILVILCKDFRVNQDIAYSNVMSFVGDLCKNFGAEELLCEIFRNNYTLLCRAPNPAFQGSNIVGQMLKAAVAESGVGERGASYWIKIGKLVSVLQVLTSFKTGRIDINQRLISSELFQNNTFSRIFFDIKTMNQRIRIMHPTLKRWMEIEQIREGYIVIMLERIFNLFSELCENRNFISKRYIHSYLSEQGKDSIQVIISYLNVLITPTFTNTLFSFITNCYIDSAPRISRHRPLALILFQVNASREGSRLSAEETIMSGRLKDALLDNAERSYATRPIDLPQQIPLRPITSEPSLTTEQLAYFKDYLTEKVNDNSWTPDLLRSIRILMQLECYSVKEIQEIKTPLNNAIINGKLPAGILEFAMEFLDEVCLYCLEGELKKINTYLQLQYAQGKDITRSDIPSLLPLASDLPLPLLPDLKQATIQATWQLRRHLISDYNGHAEVLRALYAGKQLKESVMRMFLADQHYSFPVLSIVFRMMQKFFLPKLELVKLLSRAIIIPEEEVNTYEELFGMYKRLKYLISTSENWINSQQQNEEYFEFLTLINRLSNYIFGDLVEGDLNRLRLGMASNIKHQLLINNFSFHLLVLDLLNKVFYLIEGKIRKEVPKKVRDVFETCFSFLEYFCRHSPEGIRQIVNNIYIVDRYRTLAEMGQIRLLTLLYREEESLSRQLSIGFFQSIFNKIVKQGKGNQNCEFNPEYIEFIYTCCWSKNEVIKRNLQMINKILEKQTLLRKILFMEKKDEQYHLCLEIVKFKAEPLHVPFIYHKEVIRLLTFLIVKLEAAGNPLRNRLKHYISTEKILELLALPDIYSCTGLLPELNFLLKKELFPLLHVYTEKNDSLLRYHDNKAFIELLSTYITILTNQKELKSMQIENQYLMVPFLRKYRKALDGWRQNLRDHFEQQIRPVIMPFYTAIERLPNRDKNKAYQKLLVLAENIPIESLTHNRQAEENLGMQLINIRWQNFVDDDEENSPEEKFAKKNVLEILRNERTYKIVEEERTEFYRALQREEKDFLAAISRLVKMAVSEESTLDQEQVAFENFYLTIETTAEYLTWRSNQSEEEKGWEGKELVETLINYVSRQGFNYNKPLARKSLYQILRIFNEFLHEDKTDNTLKKFYKILHENHSCFRFFNSLKECMAETSHRIDSEVYYQQINLVMSEIYLCGEQRKQQLDKQALRFLSLLCKYQPFTQLLRSQPYSPSIDFLDKIYNSFYFMIREHNSNRLILNAGIVDITEAILDCLTAFLNGCNQANQNFIVDNKFTDIVMAALKMEKIHKQPSKVETARRNRLLDEIIEFYASNGINLAEVFLQRTKLLDFRGTYLINRFKYNILRLLLQCTLANDRATNKVRIMVPNELLKINLIWLYEDFLSSGESYREALILRPRDDWLEVIKQTKTQIFLMIGFYYYHLIDLNIQGEKDNEEEEVEVTNDVEKQKEKIVKKFFSSINDRDRHTEKIKTLEKEPFADEMKMFYDKYYKAYEFFKSKTISIQANVFQNLVKLYFPKLPLCNQFTDQFKSQFIENAERISQDEKLKSLIEFEGTAYEIIEGEQEYQQEIEAKSSILGKLVGVMKNEEDVFLIVWVISCIIILLYLIDDFNIPVQSFSSSFGTYLTPTYLLDLLLLLVCFSNLLIGLIILVNLIVKKMPFLKRYYTKRYEELAEKEKGNYSAFIFTSLLSRTFYDIYVIIFSVMSITHPLFAGFLTVYIVSRISLGKQIVQAIVQTWFSLLIAAGLLIVFNYIYSIYIYSASYTDDTGYGKTCQTLFKCLLMLVDQSLKSGSGFLGTAVGSDVYIDEVFNLKFISEITYILFAQKVIFEIFSGTIIDKFSELREKGDSTEEDEESKCYICGQERFEIDFELEGFEQHIERTHNKFNYIYYLFYLRRKNKADYGIQEKFIWDLHEREINSWIPDGTSLLKVKKQAEDDEEKEAVKEPQHEKYYEKKIQELKKVKQRIENYNNQLKDESLQ